LHNRPADVVHCIPTAEVLRRQRDRHILCATRSA
jgi:hypothetical protein